MTISIRECFKSRFVNGMLAEFDFSQLEVAALAEITGDATLINEINLGVDIHRENAALWLRCKPEDVTGEQRKKAKVMTFQLQYGAHAKKMAETLGITVREAQEFIFSFYRKYEGVWSYHNNLKELRNKATVSMLKQTLPESEILVLDPTPTGRYYTIPARKTDDGKWYFSMTEMKNYPIQGFATGDIVPIVINMVCDNLYVNQTVETKIRVINTVHDSFMIDCVEEDFMFVLEQVEKAFREFPERFKELFDYELKVAYNYDVKFGENWASRDMHKLTREEIQLLLSK